LQAQQRIKVKRLPIDTYQAVGEDEEDFEEPTGADFGTARTGETTDTDQPSSADAEDKEGEDSGTKPVGGCPENTGGVNARIMVKECPCGEVLDDNNKCCANPLEYYVDIDNDGHHGYTVFLCKLTKHSFLKSTTLGKDCDDNLEHITTQLNGCGKCESHTPDEDGDGIPDICDNCVGKIGCDGICNSGKGEDICGVCDGDQSTCIKSVEDLLKKLTPVIDKQSNKAWTDSFNEDSTEVKEVGFIVTIKDGVISVKNYKVSDDGASIYINKHTEDRETYLAKLHTHPYSKRENLNEGVTFSDDDISNIRQSVKKNFVSFVEAGSKRFALVVEDESKAGLFFKENSKKKIVREFEKALRSFNGTFQERMIEAVKAVLASDSGMGFYETTDNVKQVYKKLN